MTANRKQTVIDLFCGAGGLSWGFTEAEYKILLGVDNDSSSIETFAENHQGKTICEDIRELNGEKLAEELGANSVDVIVGGPPCQGLSLSGPRKYEDPRNKLFLSFVSIAEYFKPKAFVIENVPGLASLYGGRVKEDIVREFSNLGYNISVKLLLAADYGVPQTRKRIFFVGLRNDLGNFEFPQPTHSPEDSFLGKKYITCEEALDDLPALNGSMGKEFQEYNGPANNDYQRLIRSESPGIYNHIATNHTERVRKIISHVPEGGNYKDLPPEYKNSRNFHVAWTRYHSKKPAPTIDTGHRHHFHYKYNRVPTVRESARLQSFPDKFVFYGNKSEQYRQVGNAVPPFLAMVIADKLKEYL